MRWKFDWSFRQEFKNLAILLLNLLVFVYMLTVLPGASKAWSLTSLFNLFWYVWLSRRV
jgi:hypothetical protein